MALILIFFLFVTMFHLNIVNFCDYSEGGLLSLVLTIATALLIPIFGTFFGSFKLMRRSFRSLRPEFLDPSLWFFGAGILSLRDLSIRFGSCKMSGLGLVLIVLTSEREELESGFFLSVDHFFTYFIEVIEFPAALFYLYLFEDPGFFGSTKSSRFFLGLHSSRILLT